MNNLFGSGAIANRFASYSLQSRYFIFVGNIHDSAATSSDCIAAEEDALKAVLAGLTDTQTLVYFSSCSIDDIMEESSPYVMHKKRAEQLIRASVPNHLIIRLPQVIGLMDTEGGLVNTLVNAFRTGDRFELWERAKRNFIDLDDVYAIVHHILQERDVRNTVINVASPHTTPVTEFVSVLEEHFGAAGNYELIARGSDYDIDVSAIRDDIDQLGIDFGSKYLLQCVRKYFDYLIKSAPLISIIVPTYNQSLGVNEFYRRTKLVLNSLGQRFEHELIFVNDNSRDDTYLKLQQLATTDPLVKVINFSRNFGNQMGITAGVTYCSGDLAVIIDDDLQDPPEIMLDFFAKWYEGYQVVYGVRPKRLGVNPLFRLVVKLYYRAISSLSDTPIPPDTGDFRLVDKVVLNQLRRMNEENRYYRGMVAWVGFRQIGYIYQRDRRYAGKSNFSFSKYVNFALNGLTSFTDKPLYFSILFGFSITTISFLLAIYLVIYKLLNPEWSIQGWTSMMTLGMFFGGVQLFSIGVVGIYVGKIYREVKGRPLFIIQDLINLDDRSRH
jgi:dolichol-phosphate mannosyltransferase